MSLRILILLLVLIFWPTSLIVSSHSLFPFIPLLLTPKLALFPLLVSLGFFFTSRSKLNLLFLVCSSLLFFLFFRPFFGQTIFHSDYERQQELIRNIHLYPNIYLARVYQNKGQILLSKFTDNLTQILDPNNYFFANHPRESRTNLNLPKFPYPTIIFFFLGLFSFSSVGYRLKVFLFAAVSNLSLLSVSSGHDLLLWPVICFFIYQGTTVFNNSKFPYKTLVYFTVSFLSLYDFTRLLITP